ncbi:hypothetical protein [Methylobacterium isbiliense]|jgi:hypothetical protein|uniref:Uncharacterized protein n=1 Tax=Methylobacterium isbiliense TaxID=315478 RepID=A0ABQ4SPY1_9HYPH|nr:hypothetical protein [Methylobacterium isbiliense]MDN3624387.1 hypothetical protein [Methylobacterium isbiliense]GJE04351.1 hypothetical protein GMJLKIPL_6312 [Methylobacterium isbiliense]
METDDPNDDRKAPLPDRVRDHLAQQLRATYNAQAEKPDYLGDPALPSAFDPQLRRLERRLKAQEAGAEAVEAALRDLTGGSGGNDAR